MGPRPARYRAAPTTGIFALDQLGSDKTARIREGRPVADTSRNPRALALVWLSRQAAAAVLGKEPAAIAPGTATGTTVSGQYDFAPAAVAWPARNVVGILRGSDPALTNENGSPPAPHD